MNQGRTGNGITYAREREEGWEGAEEQWLSSLFCETYVGRPVGSNIVSLFYLANIVHFQRLLQLGLSLGSHIAITCIAVGIRFIIADPSSRAV